MVLGTKTWYRRGMRKVLHGARNSPAIVSVQILGGQRFKRKHGKTVLTNH